jgi:hypothetical protein
MAGHRPAVVGIEMAECIANDALQRDYASQNLRAGMSHDFQAIRRLSLRREYGKVLPPISIG